MKRPPAALSAALGAALVLPAVALATIVDVGSGDPDAKPSCPTRPCLAVPRTTGYQAKVGTKREIDVIPQDGRIVAWTISLGKPGKKQIAYFDKMLGGEASARITILAPQRKLRARVVAQGEPQKLRPYFGQTVQFALRRSLAVKKGMIVALTVPTWAPALQAGLPGDTSWRASRAKGTCDDRLTQTAQTKTRQVAQYYCLYQYARLTYSATLVTDPGVAGQSTSPSPPPQPPPPPAAPTTQKRRIG
jgi:hypothetical protein